MSKTIHMRNDPFTFKSLCENSREQKVKKQSHSFFF